MKKWISLFLSVLMCMMCFNFSVFAEENENNISLLASASEMDSQGKVQVSISITKNPGLNNMGFEVSLEGFKLIGCEIHTLTGTNTNLVNDTTSTSDLPTDEPFPISLVSVDPMVDTDAVGTFATLTYQKKDSVSYGVKTLQFNFSNPFGVSSSDWNKVMGFNEMESVNVLVPDPTYINQLSSITGTIFKMGDELTFSQDFSVHARTYGGEDIELEPDFYSVTSTSDGALITVIKNYYGTAPTLNVSATAKAATSITLNPTTVSATVGDTKESIASKVKYTARYNDGSTSEGKEVTAAMLGEIDLSTSGQKTVTVTAEGQTATLTVDVAEHEHTPGEVQGTNKDATCTEPGSIQYWECTQCHQKFSDEACTQPIETDVIPALGHKLTHHPEVPATCKSDGTEEYWGCERCTLLFSDAEGKNNISAPKTITRLGHNLVKQDEVPATCTTAGTEAYWSCSRCSKLFSDENGAVEIASPTEITALGHNMTHHKAIPSNCTVNGQIEYWSCDRCEKNFADAEGNTVVETLDAPLASHTLTETEAVPPTTTASGNEAYWTCSVCNQMFADETGSNKLDTIPVIPSLEDTVEATTPQTSVNDTTVEAAVQTISNQINALLPEGYTATVNVTEGGYTAPVAGTADNLKGTAGSITYTVTITSDTDASDTVTTEAKTLTITAQEYVAPSAPSYTITVSGAYADKTTAKAGETVTVTAPYRYGYRFAGWYTSSNLDLPDRSPVSFVMPNGNVTIEAVYTRVIYYPTVDYDPPVRPSRPESEPNEVEDGWHGDQYYLDGEPVTGWLEIEHGEWYYFDRTGSMVTGWELVDNTWYYMYDSGVMATGWVKVDGSWYYLKDSGAMATGWLWVDNNWYYLSGSGAMKTGWVWVGGSWYYLSGSGAMKTGWVYVGNKWYFLKSGGAMATGWLEWNGNWYYLNNPNGDMAVDTQTPDGYYVNSDGIWVR